MNQIQRRLLASDLSFLEDYYRWLLAMNDQREAEQEVPTSVQDDSAFFSDRGFGPYLRADMIVNTYSFVDFWLARICRLHEIHSAPKVRLKHLSGKDDLHTYHLFLTRVADLDLTAVASSYEGLQKLRLVRNRLVHHGSHIEEKEAEKLKSVPGVRTVGSLLILEDFFIWDCLENSRRYLRAAACLPETQDTCP